MRIYKIVGLVLLAISLTGCAAALVGGGAAGGYYFGQNYQVEKKNNSN